MIWRFVIDTLNCMLLYSAQILSCLSEGLITNKNRGLFSLEYPDIEMLRCIKPMQHRDCERRHDGKGKRSQLTRRFDRRQ